MRRAAFLGLIVFVAGCSEGAPTSTAEADTSKLLERCKQTVTTHGSSVKRTKYDCPDDIKQQLNAASHRNAAQREAEAKVSCRKEASDQVPATVFEPARTEQFNHFFFKCMWDKTGQDEYRQAMLTTDPTGSGRTLEEHLRRNNERAAFNRRVELCKRAYPNHPGNFQKCLDRR